MTDDLAAWRRAVDRALAKPEGEQFVFFAAADASSLLGKAERLATLQQKLTDLADEWERIHDTPNWVDTYMRAAAYTVRALADSHSGHSAPQVNDEKQAMEAQG